MCRRPLLLLQQRPHRQVQRGVAAAVEHHPAGAAVGREVPGRAASHPSGTLGHPRVELRVSGGGHGRRRRDAERLGPAAEAVEAAEVVAVLVRAASPTWKEKTMKKQVERSYNRLISVRRSSRSRERLDL